MGSSMGDPFKRGWDFSSFLLLLLLLLLLFVWGFISFLFAPGFVASIHFL